MAYGWFICEHRRATQSWMDRMDELETEPVAAWAQHAVHDGRQRAQIAILRASMERLAPFDAATQRTGTDGAALRRWERRIAVGCRLRERIQRHREAGGHRLVEAPNDPGGTGSRHQSAGPRRSDLSLAQLRVEALLHLT